MEEKNKRDSMVQFSQMDFAKLIINDLNKSSSGRKFLKNYTQSQVRDIVEGYKNEQNQKKLREISQILWAKSPQYQRLIRYFSGMPTFAHVITPIKELKKANKSKVLKQYAEIGELTKLMSLKHEMTKVIAVAVREDIFYGYIHKDKHSFYIQQMPSDICKQSSVEDGILNYSVDMSHFLSNEESLKYYASEITDKYLLWKKLRDKNPKVSQWVELSSASTICIKMNEDIVEIFPPFAGVFDSIFDIEAFKELRKDKEQLGNYMLLAQELPMRTDSGDNNDFLIDLDFMNFFHNQASEAVPDNVGVVTSPMKITPIKFDSDKVDKDGVGKATRDFWEGSGASQLLFSSDNNSSAGLSMSIKTDEEIVFGLLTQIERWVNRYLKSVFSNELMFNIRILHITKYNEKEMHKMYIESAQYGVPVKSHLSAVTGLQPIEVMNMSYLENDLLKMHEEWIPLMSSHTMSSEELAGQQSGEDGRPKKDGADLSDEGSKGRDKDSNVKV